MSISQIKKQFEEFASYLNRDVNGQEKLKQLKDAVNTIRKRLAACEEKAAGEAARADVFAQRAFAAEAELAEAKIEIHQLRQKNSSLSYNLERATAAAAADADSEDCAQQGSSEMTYSEPAIKRAVKQLRTRLKYCPHASGHFRHDRFPNAEARVYDRESIAQGWSHDALWTLGAAMATLVFFFGKVALETKHVAKDLDIKDSNADSSVLRQLVQWLSKFNFSVDETEIDAGIARVVNLQPDFIPEAIASMNGMSSRRHDSDR